MKYYYDFDMEKTFTTEELKESYEENKKHYNYGDFNGFLEVERRYMNEISEEIYNALKEKETYKDLTAILMQELFENDLFNIKELAKKYTMSAEQKKALKELYNEYFEE